MVTADCGIDIKFSSSVDRVALCELFNASLNKAKDAGLIFVDDIRSDLDGRSDCTAISPVTSAQIEDMVVRFHFTMEFTECFSFDWLHELFAPVLVSALVPDRDTSRTSVWISGAIGQEIRLLRIMADWDFPEECDQ